MIDGFPRLVYRCTTRKYAKLLDGAGAAGRTRNRWSQLGEYVTYAASSRALALLEMRAHSPSGPPAEAVIAVIRLAPVAIEEVCGSALPEGWRHVTNVRECQLRGSQWYRDSPRSHVLIVPSIIVPAEKNYVIRGGTSQAEVTEVEPVDFDPRLWEGPRSGQEQVLTLLPPPAAPDPA